MGRVRRYKKFKACDPFSKRNGTKIDTVHDEPPEMFEERTKRKEKKRTRVTDLGLENEDDEYEKYLRLEMLKSSKSNDKSLNKPIRKIEGKRDNESSKEFKQRIRQETRIVRLHFY